MIFILRTTAGRENAVISTLETKIKSGSANIRAILHPSDLKGYLFIEGDLHEIEEMIKNVPHVRGMIKKDLPVAEIVKFFEARKIEVQVSRGDVVEVIGGPFKNEKGRVTRVDEAREEVTIELLEATIPIPITVSMGSIKVTEQAEKGE